MPKRKKPQPVATLAIKSPGKMTKRERAEVSLWLIWHADLLRIWGQNHTNGRFTAGLNYR